MDCCYICENCGETKPDPGVSFDDPVYDKLPFLCPKCNEPMALKPNKGITVGNKPYVKPLISQSLAIHPSQIVEHRKKFPDVDVLPDGCLKFNDYKTHDDYLKATGFYKASQRIRKSR